MRFREISIFEANGCILPSAIKLNKNGHDIKFGKGAWIKEVLRG